MTENIPIFRDGDLMLSGPISHDFSNESVTIPTAEYKALMAVADAARTENEDLIALAISALDRSLHPK